MKILIINPNSDLEMTRIIQKTAETFANSEYSVLTEPTQGAPQFIETYEDQMEAVKGMVNLVKEYEAEVDGFIIACHCDPNLDLIKEITTKPVVGIGEASIKLASMLGHSFSIVSTATHSIPNKDALVRKYLIHDALASIRAPRDEMKDKTDEEKFLDAAKLAIDEDMAEVIVLGCAGLTGLDKKLEKKLGVPVLDGVICALIIITGFVKYGVSISKKRRYNPDC